MNWLKDFLCQHYALTHKLKDLRAKSWLTFTVERLFVTLQLLSLPTWIFETRAEAQSMASSSTTSIRGNRVDTFVVICGILLLTSALLVGSASPPLILVLSVFAGWRILDVFQTVVNVGLFDHFRVEKDHVVADITRTVVLGFWNYVEVILAFGIVYAGHCSWLPHSSTTEAIYFSAVTQLTIGFGDLAPKGFGRFLAVSQGLTGLLIVVVTLARFVSLMPRIKSDSDEKAG